MCTQFQMDWYSENCLIPKIEENVVVLELVICDILKILLVTESVTESVATV